MNFERRSRELIVHRFHALLCQRTGVLDGLFAESAEARVNRGIVRVRCEAVQHAARAKERLERRIFRVVGILRLLLGMLGFLSCACNGPPAPMSAAVAVSKNRLYVTTFDW